MLLHAFTSLALPVSWLAPPSKAGVVLSASFLPLSRQGCAYLSDGPWLDSEWPDILACAGSHIYIYIHVYNIY